MTQPNKTVEAVARADAFNHPDPQNAGMRLVGFRLPEDVAWPDGGHALTVTDTLRAAIAALPANVMVGELVEGLQTVRDYISDTAGGVLAYINPAFGNTKDYAELAKRDLTRIDALIRQSQGWRRGMSHGASTLTILKTRRETWRRELGRNGVYAKMAPRIIAELDKEIEALTPIKDRRDGE